PATLRGSAAMSHLRQYRGAPLPRPWRPSGPPPARPVRAIMFPDPAPLWAAHADSSTARPPTECTLTTAPLSPPPSASSSCHLPEVTACYIIIDTGHGPRAT